MPPKDPLVRIALFWSQVQVTPSKADCWVWRGLKNEEGYGLHGRDLAHRFASEAIDGPIPEGVVIRHSCDNRPCCNPWHVVRGTHADNVADRVARGRSARGTGNGRAKLNEDQVRSIRADVRGSTVIAREYGVDPKVISQIKLGKTWRHVLPVTDPA